MDAGGSQNAWRWKWALGLLNAGVLGMTIALLIAGYEQSFIERAVKGSTWGVFQSPESSVFSKRDELAVALGISNSSWICIGVGFINYRQGRNT